MEVGNITHPVITNKAPNNTNMSRKEEALDTTLAGKENENKESESLDTTSAGKENPNGEISTVNAKKSKEKSKKQQSEGQVRPLPKPPTDKQKKNSTPKIHIPEGTRSEGLNEIHIPGKTGSGGRNPFSEKPLPGIWNKKQQTQKQHNTTVETRASSIAMGLKGIIMVAAVVLISSSEEISKAKSCDLEIALKSISLNYTVSCEYDDIKNISTTLRDLGISLLTLNLLCFLLILVFMLLHRICKRLICITFPLIGIYSVFMIMKYNEILYSKTLQKDMNYVQLQSAMAIWLEAHYTSDNISSSDAISNSWNRFFIEYDCCAVNQVTGTINDFDITPWCTTVGSCQATASQIPKTCCKYMSEDDYGSAPSDCHSSVNPGTFRSNCMNVLKQLSAVNLDECQLSLLQMSLIIIATFELVATTFEINVILWVLYKRKKGEDSKTLLASNKPTSEKEYIKKKENKKK